MPAEPDVAAALERRRIAAESTLRDAIRLDVDRFVASEAEIRLRARPHFTRETPPQALVQLRRRLDEGQEAFVEEAMTKLADLRVWYGATPAGEPEEAAGLERVLGDVNALAQQLLRSFGVPGDDRPDRPGDDELDIGATYDLAYTPAPAVLWAWRQVRAVDEVRNLLADGLDPADADGFELRLYLPEALPPATDERPTID